MFTNNKMPFLLATTLMMLLTFNVAANSTCYISNSKGIKKYVVDHYGYVDDLLDKSNFSHLYSGHFDPENGKIFKQYFFTYGSTLLAYKGHFYTADLDEKFNISYKNAPEYIIGYLRVEDMTVWRVDVDPATNKLLKTYTQIGNAEEGLGCDFNSKSDLTRTAAAAFFLIDDALTNIFNE